MLKVAIRFVFALPGVLVTSIPPSLAWGPQGHQIIAHIAATELTPAAGMQMERLLLMEGDNGRLWMVDGIVGLICNWGAEILIQAA